MSLRLNTALCMALAAASTRAQTPAPPPALTAPPAPPAPARRATSIVIQHGSGSYLGVAVIEIDSDRAKALKLKDEHGVEVKIVDENSPASKAGLKAGDVVTKVNGMPVARPGEIAGIVRISKKAVVFTVVRNKKEITLNVEIARNDNLFGQPEAFN